MPSRLPFRSLTRLVIGGVFIGLDALSEWLETADRPPALVEPGADTAQSNTAEGLPEAGQSPHAPATAIILPAADDPTEDPHRYLLTGMVFSGQERLGRYWNLAGRAARLAGNWTELIVGPAYSSRMARPLRRSLDRLSQRGQQTVDQWALIGRSELERSRRLASTALTDRVDKAIDYLTANEGVQELVQSQSAGLIDEVIEETRERTVSADNFLEAVVRSMLRRPPRWELPAPPPALKQKAEENARVSRTKAIHK